MKKVLLTTTALVMTAGVAAAEVSFSGKAQVALSASGSDDNVLTTHVDLNASISMAADNGLTMSTSVGYDAGQEADYNDDFTTDAAETGWGTGAPELTLGYNGYTISAQQNGVDNLYNGDLPGADLGISGSMGGVSFAFTSDMEDNNTSYKVGYAMGDLTATVTGTSDENGVESTTAGVTTGAGVDSAMKIALAYKMGDMTITASTDDEGAADSTNSVGISYKMDALTIGYTMAGDQGADFGEDYDFSVAYSAGALSASYATNENSRARMVVEYDLGGATAFFSSQQGGAATDTDYQAMGVNFSF